MGRKFLAWERSFIIWITIALAIMTTFFALGASFDLEHTDNASTVLFAALTLFGILMWYLYDYHAISKWNFRRGIVKKYELTNQRTKESGLAEPHIAILSRDITDLSISKRRAYNLLIEEVIKDHHFSGKHILRGLDRRLEDISSHRWVSITLPLHGPIHEDYEQRKF